MCWEKIVLNGLNPCEDNHQPKNGFDIYMLALVKEMAKAETYFILWTKLVWFAAFYNRMGA